MDIEERNVTLVVGSPNLACELTSERSPFRFYWKSIAALFVFRGADVAISFYTRFSATTMIILGKRVSPRSRKRPFLSMASYPEHRLQSSEILGPVSVARIHNIYQMRGGEDATLAAECDLLRAKGHAVYMYVKDNHEIAAYSAIDYARLATKSVWNAAVRTELHAFLRQCRVGIAHFHNTMPLVSPAAYYAAHDLGIPVVQTLHNYRMFCPAATFYRDGKICERCLGKRFATPSVVHACYRNSRSATVVQAVNNSIHSALGTYTKVIDAYIAMTDFSRQKAIDAGVPAERIYVKSHFVFPDPGVGRGDGNYAIFVGRLSPEKGLRTLVQAWRRANPPLRLRIVGDGPERQEVEQAAGNDPSIEWVGEQSAGATLDLIGRAAFLIFPSEWYETFGRVMIEALARGTPVIASDIGGNREIVRDGIDGLLYRVGDIDDLAAKITSLIDDPAFMIACRAEARAAYHARFSAADNYRRLIEIYRAATATASQ